MKDNYKRPDKTFQDTLENEDIKNLLKNYSVVKNIFLIDLNTHIRYFSKKNNKTLFRMGGNLLKVNEEKGYIVLTNGKINWSVQVKNTIFFKEISIDELRNEYENKIKKYKNKIKNLELSLQKIKKKLKIKN